MHKRMTIVLAVLLGLAACNQDPTGSATVSPNELALAQQAQGLAADVATRSQTTCARWFVRLLDTLRTTDDPEALAFLDQARAYRDSAHMQFQAGNRDSARVLLRLSFRSVLSAVVELFPNAPARTGEAADAAIARIEDFLGDRDAPRIRAILAHVKELRTQADAALAAGDSVTAFALNLRSLQILHRLVEHVRDHHRDHDDVADQEMEDVGI